MKSTKDKEGNTEESICHKTKDEEGVPYRNIAKNLGVNYRNVYEWIKKYREWME